MEYPDNKKCSYEIEVDYSEDFEFTKPKEEGWY